MSNLASSWDFGSCVPAAAATGASFPLNTIVATITANTLPKNTAVLLVVLGALDPQCGHALACVLTGLPHSRQFFSAIAHLLGWPSYRRSAGLEQRRLDQPRLLFGVGLQDGAVGLAVHRVPVDEVGLAVRLWRAARVAVHVGQHAGQDAVPAVFHHRAPGFELEVGAPLGQFGAVDLGQQLAHRLAEREREPEIEAPAGAQV